MSTKQLIGAESLTRWLTEELRKRPGCRNCTVHSVYKVSNHHSDCNWHPYFVVGQGVVGKEFTDAFDSFVEMAKERFNLM